MRRKQTKVCIVLPGGANGPSVPTSGIAAKDKPHQSLTGTDFLSENVLDVLVCAYLSLYEKMSNFMVHLARKGRGLNNKSISRYDNISATYLPVKDDHPKVLSKNGQIHSSKNV